MRSRDAGHPVVRIDAFVAASARAGILPLRSRDRCRGRVLGINPFDQPDVEASKIAARAMTDAFEKTGHCLADPPVFEEGGIALYTDDTQRGQLRSIGADRRWKAGSRRTWPGELSATIWRMLAYLDATEARHAGSARCAVTVRDRKRVATSLQFGPRFLHSTGQAYKGGPNCGRLSSDHGRA